MGREISAQANNEQINPSPYLGKARFEWHSSWASCNNSIFACREVRRTWTSFEAWMRTILDHMSFSLHVQIPLLKQNFGLEIPCQPRAVIRIGNKKGVKKVNQSMSNLHFEKNRRPKITFRWSVQYPILFVIVLINNPTKCRSTSNIELNSIILHLLSME